MKRFKLTVTKEDLTKAREAESLRDYDTCSHCLFAQALTRMLGKPSRVGWKFMHEGKDYNASQAAAKMILAFDGEEYDVIAAQLPKTFIFTCKKPNN